MPTIVKGQPTSEQVRERLAAEGRPVAVAFSTGKDAIAATLALMDAGVQTRLVYFYNPPGLRFIEDTLAMQEEQFGQPIARYPHPSFWRMTDALVFQPPGRVPIIDAAQLPVLDDVAMWRLVKKDLGLPDDTWVADGVRAADSIMRRASFTRHGVMKHDSRKVSPVHDWLKRDVMECIERHKIKLPVDYDIWGRSFDGIDVRFTGPLREHFPDDWKRLLEWYPLADLEHFRQRMLKENP